MPAYAFAGTGGFLTTGTDLAAGCYAWVHSRNDGKLLVSSQVLVSCNDGMIARFSSDEQFRLACDSYGAGSRNYSDN